MKKLLFFILLFFQILSLSAKEGNWCKLGKIQYFTEISIFIYEDGQLGTLRVGIHDYVVEGKNVIAYRNALTELRDKYSEWTTIANDNGVKQLRKDVPVKFPYVKSHYYDYPELEVGYHETNRPAKYEFVVDNSKMWMMGTQSPSFTKLSDLDELLTLLNKIEEVAENAKTSIREEQQNRELFK